MSSKSYTLNIRGFDSELKRRLKIKAAESGRTMGGLVEDAVKVMLDGEGKVSRSASTRGAGGGQSRGELLSEGTHTVGIQSGTEKGGGVGLASAPERLVERGCPHRFSEPCDECKKGRKR